MSKKRLARTVDLAALLRNKKPGSWVVLSHDMKRVLGSGKDPATALKNAEVPIVFRSGQFPKRASGVLMYVFDPRLTYIYSAQAA